MKKVTDEQLSAFLDGDLSETEMDTVSQAIAADETLADRLAVLGEVDEPVRALFKEAGEKPMRPDTLGLIEKTLADETAENNVVGFQPKSAVKQSSGWWPLAAAASVALVIGLTGGSYLTSENALGNQFAQMIGPVQENSPVYSALSTGVSGEPVTIGEHTLLPTASFATKVGFCREFELSGKSTNSRNIACTGSDGWTVVASVTINSADSQDGYSPASSSAAVMDQMIRTLMEGDILSLEDETKLITDGWK